MLDLEHRSLARLVGSLDALGHDAVQAGALEAFEPVGGRGDLPRRRRQVDGCPSHAQDRLEAGASFSLRDTSEVLCVKRQQVPRDEARGSLAGEHPHARVGRMDPQQERLEIQALRAGDDDLPVEHAPFRQAGTERLGELREVAVQRLQVARLRIHGVAVPKDDRAKAVPLRFEQPAVVGGQPVDRLGEHRLDWRLERQFQLCHRSTIAAGSPRGG